MLFQLLELSFNQLILQNKSFFNLKLVLIEINQLGLPFSRILLNTTQEFVELFYF